MEDETINREHEKGILDAIEKYPIFSFNNIFVYYKACCRATAYNHGLDKLDSIKEAIYMNRRKGVSNLLAQWLKSKNATLQLAAMRMICDPEEHRLLNPNEVQVSTLLSIKTGACPEDCKYCPQSARYNKGLLS